VLLEHSPVEGWWDEFRIEQVVVNLLTNALRYGGGGEVEVSVHGDGCNVRIDVRDHGKGIAPDFLERIFEPYERGARAGEPKGLGLGLYISRQLATSHQGDADGEQHAGAGGDVQPDLAVRSGCCRSRFRLIPQQPVVPAKAGTQVSSLTAEHATWIPASAGTTR
jgi:signal transduction histidine kinase